MSENMSRVIRSLEGAAKVFTFDAPNFFDGFTNLVKSRYTALEPHILDQAEWRAYQCFDCFQAGKCHHCGCSAPAIFFSEKYVDKQGKWGRMLNAEQWESYKQTESYKEFLKMKQKHANIFDSASDTDSDSKLSETEVQD